MRYEYDQMFIYSRSGDLTIDELHYAEILNEKAAQGWRVFHIDRCGDQIRVTFEREVPAPKRKRMRKQRFHDDHDVQSFAQTASKNFQDGFSLSAMSVITYSDHHPVSNFRTNGFVILSVWNREYFE